MRLPKKYSLVFLTLTIATSCRDRQETETAAPSETSPAPRELTLPEHAPLPDWLSVEEIGWAGDENNYAYKTVTDAEALESIQEVFGIQIDAKDANIVHSVSDHIQEYGMPLNPQRAKTILDELQGSFLKTKALPGSRFEGWTIRESSKPWGERDSSNSAYDMSSSSQVYDGLTFDKFDYLVFAHPDYMSRDFTKNFFNRTEVVFAAVDLEDGDFYITLSDWGND